MLDSIKVGVPIDKSQHKRILQSTSNSDRFRWVLYNDNTGEILFRQVSGLAHTDGASYHRELRWDIPKTWEPSTKLVLEFSIPKFWYGHNIRLLYDFLGVLQHFRKLLNQQFNLQRIPLPQPPEWAVMRLDPCYAWRFPNQLAAHQYLEGLKHFSYPKKKPIIYETSIVFPGTTYSLKFYEKYPEFRVHDMKVLVKSGAALEWINLLEGLAIGVLRCEATLRTKFLKRQGINTVADLLNPVIHLEWDEELSSHPDFKEVYSLAAVTNEYAKAKGIDPAANIAAGRETPLVDGMVLRAGPCDLMVDDECVYHHPGGGFTVRMSDRLVNLLQYFISRFLGDNVKMQSADEVKALLLQKYKPTKAFRLTSFWLYVQRFGETDAKTTFGKTSFYRSKSDLRKAGISLIDELKHTTKVDADFLRKFELKVPSPYATNHYDDKRDSLNVLDFIPLVSGNPY